MRWAFSSFGSVPLSIPSHFSCVSLCPRLPLRDRIDIVVNAAADAAAADAAAVQAQLMHAQPSDAVRHEMNYEDQRLHKVARVLVATVPMWPKPPCSDDVPSRCQGLQAQGKACARTVASVVFQRHAVGL